MSRAFLREGYVGDIEGHGGRKIKVAFKEETELQRHSNPGVVETEGTQSAGIIGSDFESHAIAETPLGRSGQPEDIAPIAVFLASDDSRWLTGETLLASGGMR